MSINIIHTPCKDCVFAEYKINTQTGCSLNKLDMYKQKGVEILEVYDDNKEFFVINGKKCLGFRDAKWFDKKSIENVQQAKDLVQEENCLKYIAVLYLEETNTINDIENIIKSLLNQKIVPIGIMVIKEKKKKYNVSLNALQKILNESHIKWRMQNFIDDDLTFDQKVRSIIRSAPMNRFYFLIYPSQYVDCSFAEKIDDYISNGNTFGCININNNLFFSYLTIIYTQNIKDIDLLNTREYDTKYETIC